MLYARNIAGSIFGRYSNFCCHCVMLTISLCLVLKLGFMPHIYIFRVRHVLISDVVRDWNLKTDRFSFNLSHIQGMQVQFIWFYLPFSLFWRKVQQVYNLFSLSLLNYLKRFWVLVCRNQSAKNSRTQIINFKSNSIKNENLKLTCSIQRGTSAL